MSPQSPATRPVSPSGGSPYPDGLRPETAPREDATMTSDPSRVITIGAAQLGPIQRADRREDVVGRLLVLLGEAAERRCDLVVFPELALTTFFPRWFVADIGEFDHFYETAMPGPVTQPLFDEARRLGIGFCLGYAELTEPDAAGVRHRFNTQILVERDGSVVARYRKVHLPGHEEHEPDRPFQHAERYFFEPGPDGFGVWRAFGGLVGMMICNDRRWPESYRVMGLQGVELILCGYNTPLHYAPDPSQDVLQGFHNALVMQAGAYQNGTWVVGVAKGGVEEGVDSLAQSMIVAPSGQIVAQAYTTGDELVVARCELDWCSRYTGTLFDFNRYRRPEVYTRLTTQRGVTLPPDQN
jgi:predicted amidohydrolase